MKLGRELDTLEDLLEYLTARGESVTMQKLRQMAESGEFDLGGLILSLAGKENDDETG